MGDHPRYYEIAGITIQVESDLPITDATFDKKFEKFRVEGPGDDTVVIRHHFYLPENIPGAYGSSSDLRDDLRQIYQKPPWAVYRSKQSWIYLGISADSAVRLPHLVAIFSLDYASGELYKHEGHQQWWLDGRLWSLTMFPTDQIFLAHLVANRNGCYLHSAGMTIDGRGLLFVGHSEAGKSTTIELLRQRLGDRAQVLCDDRNIVRFWPSGFSGDPAGWYVHGTWHNGDVPEVSSTAAPLRAILFLEQHHNNELVPLLDRKQIWRRLLATLIRPVVTDDWWERELAVLKGLVAEVPCHTMRFDKSGLIVDQLERLAE